MTASVRTVQQSAEPGTAHARADPSQLPILRGAAAAARGRRATRAARACRRGTTPRHRGRPARAATETGGRPGQFLQRRLQRTMHGVVR